MITKVRLRNFQKHKDYTLELDPVTTIIGRNSKGKSTLLRALRWVALNKPDGVGVIRHKKEEAKVELWVDGNKITKTRNRRNATYKLGTKVYKAFGKNVPNSIAKLLNVNEINFQGQLDPPLWFFETPGNLAKSLNKIIRLDTIDKVLSTVNDHKRQAEAERKVCDKRVAEAEAKFQSLKFVPKMVKELNRLKRRQAEIHDLESRIKELSSLDKALRKLGKPLVPPKIDKMNKLAGEIGKLHDRIKKLKEITSDLQEMRESSCQEQQKLQSLQKRLRKLSKKNCPTCGRKLNKS